MKNSREFEQIIGYEFKDRTLLEKALTHDSFIKENEQSRLNGNERLEFLGDAFLDAAISEELYQQFPNVEEGFLTKVRATLVCEKTLAYEGRKLRIGEFLKISRGEEKSGGRDRDSIIADAMEAVIGAMYLDGGYDQVRDYVLLTFGDVIHDAKDGKFSNVDYKSNIQETLQGKGVLDIHYILEKEEGPDHKKIFFVKLEAGGQTLGRGRGRSKKEAEQNAARDGLDRGINVF